MLYRTLSLLLLCCVGSIAAGAQTWQKDLLTSAPATYIYPYTYSDTTGGLIAASTFDSSDIYISDYYIIRINTQGDTVWAKMDYFDQPGCRAQINAVTQLTNGDYIVATSQLTFGNYFYTGGIYFRIDTNGNILNTIVTGIDINGGQDMNVLAAANGSYYLNYSYDSFYNPSSSTQAVHANSYLMRYDSNNVMQWRQEYSNYYLVAGPGGEGNFYTNASYPYCSMYTAYSPADDGLILMTRGHYGALNPDGSFRYDSVIYHQFPLYGDYPYYLFCTSDTSLVVNIYDSVGHLCRFNSSGHLMNEISETNSFGFGAGTETSNGKYLMSTPSNHGFYVYDHNFNLLDSMPDPFIEDYYYGQALIPNRYGGAFCMYPAYTTTTHLAMVNFDSVCNDEHDLQLSMFSNCLRPGFTSSLHVGIFDNSQWNIDTTTVTIVLDSNTYFSSSVPAPVYASGDTLVYLVTGLAADSTDSVFINVTTDSTTGLGVLLAFHALSPYANNVGLDDDTVTYLGTTVSSLDPNFKSVDRTYFFTADRALVYTIGFENTGSYMAQNVTVTDTLDAGLDPATLKIVGGSPFKPALSWPAEGVARFSFSNIDLPDSLSSPTACYGQVIYSIQTRSTAPLGELIQNKASVFFDHNAPVETNTTANIISTQNTAAANDQAVVLFPNPFSNSLLIQLPPTNNPWDIAMFDITGRNVLHGTYYGSVVSLAPAVPCGMYVLRITNLATHSSTIKKVVKIATQ